MMYQICLTFVSAEEVAGAAFVAAVAVGVSEATPNIKEVATVAKRAIRTPLDVAREIDRVETMNFVMAKPNSVNVEIHLMQDELTQNLLWMLSAFERSLN